MSVHGDAVETVFIPEAKGAARCASRRKPAARSDCRFCSTGHQGFSRNLTTAEIVAQLMASRSTICAAASAPLDGQREQLGDDKRVITNVVMMGMGEPLQNYSGRCCPR